MEVYWGDGRVCTARACAAFKDGKFIRRVEVTKNGRGNQCRIVIKSVENVELKDADLEQADPALANFFIVSITPLLSSQDGRLCLVLGGFFPDGPSHSVIVKLDYYAEPEVVWRQVALPS